MHVEGSLMTNTRRGSFFILLSKLICCVQSKARSIVFNLGDLNNKSFVSRVLGGALAPREVARMSTDV